MITFKKSGRPTKVEKGLVKNINNLFSSISEDDRKGYDFYGERVTNEGRLNEIWDLLNGDFTEGVLNNDIIPSPFTEGKSESKVELVEVEKKEVIEPEPEIETKEEQKEPIENEHVETNEKPEEKDNFVKEEDMNYDEEAIVESITEGNEDIIDNSEVSDEIPSSFNPLNQPIKERSYNVKKGGISTEIPEPDFGAQPSAEEEHEQLEADRERDEEDFVEEEKEEKVIDRLTNPEMEDLNPKDKKEAAKQLVETVLGGYEMLHELGKNWVEYPEAKLDEKIIKGEVDPTMSIPIDEHGGRTNVRDFFIEYNESAKEAISYDQKFGEKVRPAMERVFAKKGWGMTDEQFLLVEFGKDLSWKAVQVMNLKKTANNMMEMFVELQREKIEAMGANPSQTHQPDTIVTPPSSSPTPEPEPIYQHNHENEEEEDSENDIPATFEIVKQEE